MPTIRATKRLLMPINPREKTIVERIICDQSELWHISNSDAIIRDILDSAMPSDDFGRRRVEAVFAGEESLLTSVSCALRDIIITLVDKGFAKSIVAFGMELISQKCLSISLDIQHPNASHMRACLAATVQELERHLTEADDLFDRNDLQFHIDHGRGLLETLDPERFSSAPAYALIKFYADSFGAVGQSDDAIAYVADAFAILADTEIELMPTGRIKADTAELRHKWIEVLNTLGPPST